MTELRLHKILDTAEIPAQARHRVPGRCAIASDHGQLRDAQARQSTAWPKRHPRFVPHFVPTSSSWMNLAKRWFGHLDNKAIERGVFHCVADLQSSIESFLIVWNLDPKPFVWTATVESIQEKLNRCRQTLEQISPGSTSPKSRKQRKGPT